MSQPLKAAIELTTRRQNKAAILVTFFIIVAFYLLALRTGAAFIFFGYVWADTCWLIRMGQIIADARAVPNADLFSFTLPILVQQGNPQPYVVYQWLSELLFYCGFSLFKPVGLLIAGALLMTLAFLTIPLRACRRANAPIVWSFLVVGAASLAANVRCVIRPEIFTYFNLAVCLALLQTLRKRVPVGNDDAGRIDWKMVGWLTLLMSVWCNLHSGFVCGVILIAIYALSFLFDDLLAKRSLSNTTKTLLLGLLLAALGTLVNPYGIGLWIYLPHLFFMPINAQIDECKSLLGLDFNRAVYFILVTILCWAPAAMVVWRSWKMDRPAFRSLSRQSSLILILIATLSGFWMRRLTPMAALIMVFETANYTGSVGSASLWLDSFWKRRFSLLVFELAMLIMSALGVLQLAGKSVIVTIPSCTQEFTPPFPAVRFFMETHRGGRVFSSLPIGDMLDMYWGPQAALLIDSRMDAYSESIIQDYLCILYGKEGWRNLLDRYQIEWVFVSRDKPVGQLLERQRDWDALYKDSTAIIFRRRQSSAQ